MTREALLLFNSVHVTVSTICRISFGRHPLGADASAAQTARSPNLNAYSERWVRSVKEECLSKVILFGERSLRRALREYVEHFHAERNHQGKGNVLLFPRHTDIRRSGPVRCRERLGGLLRYYHQQAA